MFHAHIKSTYVSFINRNKCCRVEIIVYLRLGRYLSLVIVDTMKVASAYSPTVPSRLSAIVFSPAST